MLKIFNDLEPFFKDNYRRINVREYARIRKLTPPTASKLLSELEKERMLKKEVDRNYIFYRANRESKLFVRFFAAYWLFELEEAGLIAYLESALIAPTIILFGSFSKAEINKNSDIDLAAFTRSEKTVHIDAFEKKLKRKIHIFTFKDRNRVKNPELLNNILAGVMIVGEW